MQCYLLPLPEGTEHDDTAALILHHHPPQVSSGVLQGTLSGDVPSPLLVALHGKDIVVRKYNCILYVHVLTK